MFRDSHFSGLPISVDLDRLFYTVRIKKIKGKDTLCVTHTGATPLEQILFSKMVLFTSVYQHHKVRACDCMFAGIIEYMQEHDITLDIGSRKLAKRIWEEAGRPCLKSEVWVDLPERPSVKSADETYVIPAEFEGVTPVSLNNIFPTSRWTQQYGIHKWRGHVFCPPKPKIRKKIGKAAKDIIEKEYQVKVKDEAFLWCKNKPPAKNIKN